MGYQRELLVNKEKFLTGRAAGLYNGVKEVGFMYKKILVPLDGSELAKKGLAEAEKLAPIFGAEIVLFQVVPFMPIYGSPELVTPLIVDEKQKETAERYLHNLAEEVKEKRVQGHLHGEDRPASSCGNHRLRKGEWRGPHCHVHPRSVRDHPVGLGECGP